MSEGDNPSDFAQSVQSTAVQPPTAGLYCFNREEANARLDSKAIRNSLMRWSSFSSSFSSTFLGFFWWWEKWHRKTHEIPTNVKEWFQRKHWKPFKHMMSDWFIAKSIDVHCTHKSGANGGAKKPWTKTLEKTCDSNFVGDTNQNLEISASARNLQHPSTKIHWDETQ